MKYIVMECHPAYAVLMDEASRVVRAANLHYEVGQVVEKPVLLQEKEKSAPHITATMRRVIAAAACIVVMIGGSAVYYHSRYTAYSSVMVCAKANMTMEVSRTGQVVSVQPLNQDAAQLLSDYHYNGKDPLTVTNELIDRAVEQGYIQKGDTVGVYYEKDKNKDPEQFHKDVEESITSHELNAEIHDDYDKTVEPPAPPAAPPDAPKPPDGGVEPPAAPHKDDAAPVPPAAPKPEDTPAPVEPPAKPDAPAVPGHEPGVEPPPAPADPAGDDNKPVPPLEEPAEKPVPPEDELPAPAVDEPHIAPAPPVPVPIVKDDPADDAMQEMIDEGFSIEE